MDTTLKPRFQEILFPTNAPFSSYQCEGSRGIGPLSLVNIFIGPNNSGKSRLLRAMFSLEDFSYTTNFANAEAVYALIGGLKSEYDAIFGKTLSTIANIKSGELEDILAQDPKFISPTQPIHALAKSRLEKIAAAQDGNMSGSGPLPSGPHVASKLRALGSRGLEQLSKIDAGVPIKADRRYYIPMLRGMRPFANDSGNPYRVRTKEDYFQGQSKTHEEDVFTGLDLYDSLKRKLLGEPEDREAVREFEEFLSKRFFRSRKITLIPRDRDTTVHVKIGDEKQLPIYHLGDGLQNLIICTFNIVMEKIPCLFFIEEPDMCMHPSLQRSFLEVLSEFDIHQYFFTSHSNHLLDMTLDYSNISIFHFSKLEHAEPEFHIRVASSRDTHLLLDLGVRNSSVFLTNATIWVEGITDRLYLRAYMQKYIAHVRRTDKEGARKLANLKEDSHYSFVEYQGSTLTHWGFDPDDEDFERIKASFLCARAFVIADGDLATKGAREETYRLMLGDRLFLLPSKEIENQIPEAVLKRVVRDDFAKAKKDLNLIRYKDYSKRSRPLGRYLDRLLDVAISTTRLSGTTRL
jgi:hypothetical protein